jgi:hypothetical protein
MITEPGDTMIREGLVWKALSVNSSRRLDVDLGFLLGLLGLWQGHS